MNGFAYARLAACSWIARITRSWPWPMFTHISWLLESRYRFPSGVQNQHPFAPATGSGSAFDCAHHSKTVCALVRRTISSPVIARDMGAVVIGRMLLPLPDWRLPIGGERLRCGY